MVLGTRISFLPVIREAMRTAFPAAAPQSYVGMQETSMSTSSPMRLWNSYMA